MKNQTLEILIPTYNRPISVIQTIKSCLAIKDTRLTVRCNSNHCYHPFYFWLQQRVISVLLILVDH